MRIDRRKDYNGALCPYPIIGKALHVFGSSTASPKKVSSRITGTDVRDGVSTVVESLDTTSLFEEWDEEWTRNGEEWDIHHLARNGKREE